MTLKCEGTLFYNKNLNKVELPSTLTYLPDYMLAGCDNINNPAGFMTQHLGDIGDYALYNQSQHSTINIPYGVYRIGTRAMADDRSQRDQRPAASGS